MLSFDTELAWGTPGMTLHNANLRPFYERKREMVNALLGLLEKYRIKATWAIVGHLFLDTCGPQDGRKHPEIVRPNYHDRQGDWFDIDPCTSLAQDPIWYGADIVKRIRECSMPQEIGCHTFSHIEVSDPGCSAECFDSELKECRRLARELGIDLRSFVFPKNEIAHLETLRSNGFACFRGKDVRWFIPYPKPLRRVAHVFDNFVIPWTPAVFPRWEQGLWHIPGSYFFPHSLGWANWLPASFRVRKVKQGVRQAIRKGGLYHLWTHPFTLATHPALLEAFEEIFDFVSQKQKQGDLTNFTMGEMATYLNA